MNADLVRYLAVAVFGVGAGFMVVTNVLAFNVLRPPKKLGFLWWHVTAISISFLLLGSVAIDRLFDRLDTRFSWQLLATAVGLTLYTVAQVIIFNVERSRLLSKRAAYQVGLDGDAIFDPATRETGISTELGPREH